ncbi:MAG TPA: choice-of-anchor Q domain-containing protein, partial [Candidatus Obscuribacterales bacterium]
ITGTVFEDNVANGSNGDEGGGAIFFETNDSSLGLNIVDSVFRRNTVPNGAGRGGAIYAEQDSSSTFVFNIQSSVFYSNTANQGGAIHFEFTEDDPNWNISNSVFFKNIARQHGGAISINDESSANLDIMSCTFFDNHAGTAGSGNGGAIEVLGSNDLDLRIYNSIFWDNSSNDGDDDNQIFDDGNGSNIDLQNNIIEAFADDGLGGFGFVDNGGNLDDDPMFFSPNQLLGVDNLPGTADDGLRPTAVAINAGKTLVVEDVPDALQDIAGVSRPRGSAFDIGAFEVE